MTTLTDPRAAVAELVHAHGFAPVLEAIEFQLDAEAAGMFLGSGSEAARFHCLSRAAHLVGLALDHVRLPDPQREGGLS